MRIEDWRLSWSNDIVLLCGMLSEFSQRYPTTTCFSFAVSFARVKILPTWKMAVDTFFFIWCTKVFLGLQIFVLEKFRNLLSDFIKIVLVFLYSKPENLNSDIVDLNFELLPCFIKFFFPDCFLRVFTLYRVLEFWYMFSDIYFLRSYFMYNAEFQFSLCKHMVYPALCTPHDCVNIQKYLFLVTM